VAKAIVFPSIFCQIAALVVNPCFCSIIVVFTTIIVTTSNYIVPILYLVTKGQRKNTHPLSMCLVPMRAKMSHRSPVFETLAPLGDDTLLGPAELSGILGLSKTYVLKWKKDFYHGPICRLNLKQWF
jgi:hypothetical protein